MSLFKTSLLIVACMISLTSFCQKKQLPIGGFVKPGFEPVYEEFRKNFKTGKELGAALCVYYQGEKVIDLWGGIANRKAKTAWKENTQVLFFSATKGVAALCLAKLHSEGKIDYGERVTSYWPGFGKMGKENITVSQLVSHQSGLCLWEGSLNVVDLSNRERLLEKLENARPYWNPGDYSGYSAGMAGHYIGELVRRIDDKHRSLGQYFQDEIAKPLRLNFYIGLPDSIADEQIAIIQMNNPLKRLFMLNQTPKGVLKALVNPRSLFMRSISQVKNYQVNNRETWKVEEPSGNGIGDARSLAKLYSIFSTGGRELAIRSETLQAYSQPALLPKYQTVDRVMGVPLYYRNGFMKNGQGSTPFANDYCYGFGGASGSMAFADPIHRIGYCYVPNKMGYDFPDSRETSIQRVLYQCIENLKAPK